MSSTYQTQRYLNLRDAGITDGLYYTSLVPSAVENVIVTLPDATSTILTNLTGLANPLTDDLYTAGFSIAVNNGSTEGIQSQGVSTYVKIAADETAASEKISIVTSGTNGENAIGITSAGAINMAATGGASNILLTGNGLFNSAGTIGIEAGGIISIGTDVATGDINVGTGGVRTITIGSNVATSTNINSVAVSILATSGAASLDSTGGAVNVGIASSTGDVNVGIAGARTITIGSSAFASTTNISGNVVTIQGNSGGVTMNSAGNVSINGNTINVFNNIAYKKINGYAVNTSAITFNGPTLSNGPNCHSVEARILGSNLTSGEVFTYKLESTFKTGYISTINNIDNASNTIYPVVTQANLLTVGQVVKFAAKSGIGAALPTNISEGVNYYITTVSTTSFKIASAADDAQSGTAVDISQGSANFDNNCILYIPSTTYHEMTISNAMDPAIVNTTNNTINIENQTFYDTLSTGTKVIYSRYHSNLIGGLTDGNAYYIVLAGSNHIQLAESFENALASSIINIGPVSNLAGQAMFYVETARIGQVTETTTPANPGSYVVDLFATGSTTSLGNCSIAASIATPTTNERVNYDGRFFVSSTT